MSGGERFHFIDRFRGLVGIMMALGHSSYYFNSVWLILDPLDPFFGSIGQFALRYMGYLCAPGFLMMNGAMTWFSYQRRTAAGHAPWRARWHLIQRGLFLVLVQITWVNSSWGGFTRLRLNHIGIIACIGLSMCLLAFLVHTSWRVRLGVGLLAFVAHAYLLRIPYDPHNPWMAIPMQTFIDAGHFNKYPVLPWFGLAVMGSVMATAWIDLWKTPKQRILGSILVAIPAFGAATLIRMGRGFGNIEPFSYVGHWSFFLDQKYPPSLYHNLWFFGAVVLAMAAIMILGRVLPFLVSWLGRIGKVPLFFYGVHIALLGIFSKRLDLYYREGEVLASLIGWVILLAVMYPLAIWFGRVKRRSKNYLIRLI
ncbi:MAG: DUF1624 domain-containing protein [Candidatus Eisenbacteria bacterium]|nr:DUF1624 domain-containing protein [Candidatus Latescibacterota bacterium]MBD3301666.1 DUF1624 domain-containing protein [Candidatus Eisenbacteria bacterium]